MTTAKATAPMTVGVALGRLDDCLRDAHAALEIVDFLIEKGASSHLAYRATNPVFSAIREMLDIVEAASAAEKGAHP
jgi:hypothetical protein